MREGNTIDTQGNPIDTLGFFAAGATMNCALNAIGTNHAIAANNPERAIVKRDSRGEIIPYVSPYAAAMFQLLTLPMLAQSPSAFVRAILDRLPGDYVAHQSSFSSFKK